MGIHLDSFRFISQLHLAPASEALEVPLNELLILHDKRVEHETLAVPFEQLQLLSGLSTEAYDIFLEDYVSRLDESPYFQETPSGIEDALSYLGVQKIPGDAYLLLHCIGGKEMFLQGGIVGSPQYEEHRFQSYATELFTLLYDEDGLTYGHFDRAQKDLADAFVIYAKQAAFLEQMNRNSSE